METLYLRADEIVPGDILPDVSRFPVENRSEYARYGVPYWIRLSFVGTRFTRSVDPLPYPGEIRYPVFRVERAS